jgi:hypothetical protein
MGTLFLVFSTSVFPSIFNYYYKIQVELLVYFHAHLKKKLQINCFLRKMNRMLRLVANQSKQVSKTMYIAAFATESTDRVKESHVAPLVSISKSIFGNSRDRFNKAKEGSQSASTLKSTDVEVEVSQVIDDSTENPVDKYGNKILYRGEQELVVRMLFGASSFNFVYWTYYTATAYYYQDVVIHGIDLGGDIRWGAVGAFATGLMFYATKTFKDNACYMAYLVKGDHKDDDRFGFQMHDFFGGPGRRVEANIGNCHIITDDGSGTGRGRFGSSFLPLRVKGMGKNVLIDEKGKFFYNDEFRVRLHERVTSINPALASDDEPFAGVVDSKAKRAASRGKSKRRGK